MLDSHIRPFIQTPLTAVATCLYRVRLSPNQVTALGLLFALFMFCALYFNAYWAALLFLILNRLADGLDGPLAQKFAAEGKVHNSDFGAYFDILSDFIFYAGFPLFFAFGAPEVLLPAAILLFAFILSGTSFLAYAVIAEKKKLVTDAQGKKGFYYMAGLMEGSETIGFFVVMLLWPQLFTMLAYIFAGLCVLTLIGRVFMAYKNF